MPARKQSGARPDVTDTPDVEQPAVDEQPETPPVAPDTPDVEQPPADTDPRVRVRMLVGVAGLDFGWAPGEEVEMSEEDAQRWADGERAERVEHTDQPRETAARQSRGGGTQPRPETRG